MTASSEPPRAAIVRPPGDAFALALSSHPDRASIDPARARDQHAAYRAALADLVELVVLAADEELPDACFAEAAGGRVEVVQVPAGALHLQSAVTALAPDAVVGTAELLAQPALRRARRRVQVPPAEAAACNVVVVGTTALLPAGCPQTAAAVAALGFEVRQVDLGEFHKADGGATCLSLLV
jgi:N-dimethylarginine dimethylaminohydrolase